MKLTVQGGFELPGLEGAVPGAEMGQPVDRRVDDTYYDTEDLRLLRWGVTLRHRKRKGWTVKLPVSRNGRALVRDEVTYRGRAGRPPPGAVDLVGSFARGRPLVVTATVSTDRTARSWLDADGQLLVELVDDSVVGETADGRASTFRQLEVELGPSADLSLLDDLVDRLVAAGATPEPAGIKVVKVLGADAIGPPEVVVAPLEQRPSAGDVMQQALARSVVRLMTDLPVAQVGEDPEGVHQARVATRRLRSDLQTFGPLLDPGWAKALRDDLRPLTAQLGTVRDADVLLDRFRTMLQQHPEIDGDGAQGILDLLSDQRRVSHAALLDHLAGGTVNDLLDRLVAGVVDAPTTHRADDPARERLPRLVRKRWRRLDKAVQRLGPDPEPVALHRVRILTKGTRYAAEAVSGAFGPRCGRFAKSLAKVQDCLGEHNDAIVAERWLVASAAELAPTSAFAAGRLAQLLHAEANLDHQSWKEPYQTAARKRNRSWFTD